MTISRLFVAWVVFVAAAGLACAQTPEFPPGVFTDGGHYKISDFKGKALVLVFYEQSCPRCRGEFMPEVVKAAAATKGTPVRLIAVGPLDSLAECAAYRAGVGLSAPVFADTFGALQQQFGHTISMNNIIQCNVILPDGSMGGANAATEQLIKNLAEKTKWRYKDDGYAKPLAQAVEAFEWNQYETGMKLLKPQLTSGDKATKGSAAKLLEKIKAEASDWFAAAEKKLEAEPVAAYDTCQRLVAMFDATDDLAKTAAARLAKLRDQKEIKDELEARKLYAQLDSVVGRANVSQKNELVAFCKRSAQKYPDTPTGKKIAAFGEAVARMKAE